MVDLQNARELLINFVRRFGLLDAIATGVCCGDTISIIQSHILYEISRTHNPSMKQVADAVSIDITTFSRQIKALERRGIIRRRQNSQDRRVHFLALTPKGRRIKETIDRTMLEYLKQVFFHLTGRQQKQIFTSFMALNNALAETGKVISTAGESSEEEEGGYPQ